MNEKVTFPTDKAPVAPELLTAQLLQRVRQLSFPAYCHLIRLLLYRSGYSSVQLVEPMARHFQLNPDNLAPPNLRSGPRPLYSGLLAVSHTDLSSALTLVRIKQAKGVGVSRRFVDQLRGAMLRLGAEQGVLIATGRFSRFARTVATQVPLPPIRLIDGEGLCAMLRERRIGLCQVPDNSEEKRQRGRPRKDSRRAMRWTVDEPFFAALERRALLLSQPKRSTPQQPKRRPRNTSQP